MRCNRSLRHWRGSATPFMQAVESNLQKAPKNKLSDTRAAAKTWVGSSKKIKILAYHAQGIASLHISSICAFSYEAMRSIAPIRGLYSECRGRSSERDPSLNLKSFGGELNEWTMADERWWMLTETKGHERATRTVGEQRPTMKRGVGMVAESAGDIVRNFLQQTRLSIIHGLDACHGLPSMNVHAR